MRKSIGCRRLIANSWCIASSEVGIDTTFTHFTRAYIERTHNLQVLAICRGCKAPESANPDYPSWAIDYRFSKSKESMPWSLISWGIEDWKGYPQGLSAGGHEQSAPAFVNNLLGLGGFQFDTVAAISMVKDTAPSPDWEASATGRNAYWLNTATFYPHFVTSLFASWKSAIEFSYFYIKAKKLCVEANPSGTYRPTGQTSLEAFWQTIRGRETPIDHPETPSSTKALFEDVDRILTRQSRLEAPFGPILALTFAIYKDPRLISFFAQAGLPKQRRFLITNNGYIGLVPRETRVGDSILVLQGHVAPVVARSTSSDHWRMVGESYIHGIMEGEAFLAEKCRSLWFE